MVKTSFTHFSCRAVVATLLVIAGGVGPRSADAQTTVAAKYHRAEAREQAARTAEAPPISTLRSVAVSYEQIVRQHPRSSYSDNALWQGAGLLELAYERGGAARDLDGAKRLLTWLKREYPTSALAKRAGEKLASLTPAAKPAASAAVTTRAPERTPTSAAVPNAPVSAARSATPEEDDSSVGTPAAVTSKPIPPPVMPARPATNTSTRSAATAETKPTASSIKNVAQLPLPRGDRIVIELSAEVPYTVTRLSGPDRIAIDLPNVQSAPAVATAASDLRGGLVRRASLTRSADGAARLVVEVTGNPRFSTFPLYGPYRLVVDIEAETPIARAPSAPTRATEPAATKSTAAVTASALPLEPKVLAPPPASPTITSRGDYSLARQLGLGVSRVVIDPGHGGHDPGAKANGLTEAGVVLDVALKLEKLLLAKPGFEVVLTRRTDEYIPLEARTALANQEAADLFVSIHVNAAPRAALQGVETFFLDFASNPQAEALAARENAASAHAMRELPTILKAIATNNKLEESRELARLLQASLVRSLSANRQSGKDLGVKRAPFVVLIGAQMPSVLTEISFLTNKSEAGLLKQSSHRQKIAQALADAIVRYQTSLKKVSNVAQNAVAN